MSLSLNLFLIMYFFIYFATKIMLINSFKKRFSCSNINKIEWSGNIAKCRYVTNIFSQEKAIYGKSVGDAGITKKGSNIDRSDSNPLNPNIQKLQNQIDELKKETEVLISEKNK